MSFKGFQQTGVYGLTRKPTNLFGGVPSNTSNIGSLQYSNLPNLVGWYNNSDGVTTATGVSAWVDRVSATSLAQSTGASQPTYTQQVQTLNGNSKITFTAGQFLTAGDVFDIRTNTGYTICMYGKLTASNSNRLFYGKSTNNGVLTTAGEYGIRGAGVGLISGQFFDNVSLKSTGTYAYDSSNYFLYSLVVDITNSLLSLYVNDKPVSIVAISNTIVDYNNGISFGIGNATTIALEFLEGIIYQTALSQSEISQNLLALKNKFGQI